VNVSFYFYFPARASADELAMVLENEGFEVKVRMGADNVNWLTLATKEIGPSELDVLEERFEELAKSHGGEYDGNEIELGS
jgi:Regulator of ribonuclease activity B